MCELMKLYFIGKIIGLGIFALIILAIVIYFIVYTIYEKLN